ncbi:MAG: 50S ribosomal protein L11 methyltransferase [Labilithrix sp.]|nr:50S ribosomal protein L11 methyltransferase [Labilithrix sp.]
MPTEDAPLTAETILVRARELNVRLGDDDEIRIEIAGETFAAPRVALAVLDAFAQPQKLGDAMAKLASTGHEHFIEASAVVVQLARAGILRPPGERDAARVRGYVRPSIHIAMLDDRARTKAFCDAVRALVTPGDVVADIGTGTGVLAASAAAAGARRVYAIESTAIADVAAQLFVANGVADRVSIIRERSTHATLPERATILVTEMIGDDPLDEHLLEIVDDAKKRLLAPGARVVPSEIEIFALALDVPADVVERQVFTASRLAAWKSAYGLDFSPLARHRPPDTQSTLMKTSEISSWPRVAEPVLVETVCLERPFETSFTTRRSIVLDAGAARLGVALAFRATLAPGIVLSTLLADVDPKNHWHYPLWLAHDRPAHDRGAAITIEYAYQRGSSSLRFVET